MSRSGDVTLDWGGNPERSFRLAIGQIRKLQEKRDAGPLGIASRCLVSLAALRAIRAGDFESLSRLDLKQVAELEDVREVLLQGLLGANVAGPEALALVRDWVEHRPLGESLLPAYSVCMAAILGAEDEEAVGESPAVGEGSPRSPTAKSDSGKTASTPSAAPSDGSQSRSTA
jgi:hypothetical protein